MNYRVKPSISMVTVAGLIVASAVGTWNLANALQRSPHPESAIPTAVQTIVAPMPSGTAPNYRAIVQAAGPAVVGISVEGSRKVDGAEMPDFSADPFFQFFRGLPGMQAHPHGSVPFKGQGSGFVVSTDGVVLTNAHVVRDAKDVTVKFSDRRELRAKVLGADPATDVAVLKVDAKGLPTVVLGDPRSVEVGDYVLAIGSPFGFEQSASQGIVSAKGRSLPSDSLVPFIQTDAAVNPGNSGGPLFDASGRVIGINAQIYSASGGFQGLAFAIPIDVALHVRDQIVAKGRVEHARLGVMLQDLNQSLAESFGMDTPDGALVASVTTGSAAAKAGLAAGDVIMQINGEKVRTSNDVSPRVGLAVPGDQVKLTVRRDGSSVELTARLGSANREATEQVVAEESADSLGLAVRPLTAREKRESRSDHGLLVEDVDGASARAGIKPGDIVLSLNGKAVSNLDQVRDVLRSKPKAVALLVQRGDQKIFVPIRLG
jgi:serine protease Do